ncbi:MAG: hypothetical protein ISR59_13345 [Anaerolineales bacterium]|uniref:Uncharacterized protein n=1 Tax=Candidatus Desulfolinea nitratireducens TaxID=2841698 RepID=A0A8J6NH98_9CHLR|nr:hypothetical protein [Candidatus Desulfolinea nitratireducens]MBL6962086.1 hypothetical protein [Anaerolineales bacterium]
MLHRKDIHVPPEGYRDDVRTVQAEYTRVPAHSAGKVFLCDLSAMVVIF